MSTAAAPPPDLSVVVPLYNEFESVSELLHTIHAALQPWGRTYEIVLVDDGSHDGTVARVKEVATAQVRLVELSRNFGQTQAMKAGIEHANGVLIATMDGDLQNDPADLPAMIAKLEDEEWDVVAGIRANRQDGEWLRKLPSRWANRLIRQLTGVHLQDYGCTLKVFRRDVALCLGLYGELHRFIPVLAAMQGARITEMPVRHHARRFGESKYGLGRIFRVLSDLLLMIFMQRFLSKPMHLFGTIGFVATGLGLLINLYLLVCKLFGDDIWGRPLLMLGTILLVGGLQFLMMGVFTELQMRTYYESQNKKTYRVRRVTEGSRPES
jgi:glycosyltransferase involved in cell wall biosynthesis